MCVCGIQLLDMHILLNDRLLVLLSLAMSVIVSEISIIATGNWQPM